MHPNVFFHSNNQAPAYIFTDADAANYVSRVIAAGGTVSDLKKGYIDTYFAGLKTDGIWTKIQDRALTIWGVADANAQTFKNTVVTNFNLMTHYDGYVQGTTGNVFIDLNIVPSTSMTLNNTHTGVYIKSNLNVSNGIDIGAYNGSTQSMVIYSNTGGNFIGEMYSNNATTGRITIANASTLGYFMASRISSADYRAYKNGAQIGVTKTSSGGSLPSGEIYVGSVFNVGTGLVSGTTYRRYAMWTVGLGLSVAEAAADNTRTETLMDAMGYGVQ